MLYLSTVFCIRFRREQAPALPCRMQIKAKPCILSVASSLRLRKSTALPTPCPQRFRCAKNNTQLFFAFSLHRRIVLADRLRKSTALPTPCFGRFRCAKNNTQLFFACYIYFLIFSIADFSRRDTCAWLIPISSAISICVFPA